MIVINEILVNRSFSLTFILVETADVNSEALFSFSDVICPDSRVLTDVYKV